MNFKIRFKGGPGSGHRGHSGRPGLVGGSLPGKAAAVGEPSKAAVGELAQLSGGKFTRLDDPDNPDFEMGMQDSTLIRMPSGDKAIIKPDHRGSPFIDDPDDFKYDTTNTEVAAYEAAMALNYGDLVPPTALAEFEGKSVSAQLWIEGADTWSYSSLSDLDVQSYKRLMILDGVIGNMDRHGANLLVKNNKVVGIDHASSFNERVALSDVWPWTKDMLQEAGHSDPTWTAADATTVRGVMANTKFKSYITSTFSSAAWGGVEARCNDMLRAIEQEE